MRKRRGNTRYFVWFLSIIGGSFLAFRLILFLLYSLNVFLINELTFTGQTTLLEDNLKQVGDELIGRNLFRVSENEVKDIYTSISRIKELSISRRLFDKLQINIIERKPVFQILTRDGKIMLVDDKSVVLSLSEASQPENLTIISVQATSDTLEPGKRLKDPFLSDMLKIYPEIKKAEPDFFDFISEIYIIEGDLYMVENRQGYRIILPTTNLLQNIIDYMDIKNTYSFDNKTIIDMTIENNYRVSKREN